MKLILFFTIFFPSAIFAAGDGFSLNIEPIDHTVLTIPGQVNRATTNLITSNSSKMTVYPLAFDWDKKKNEFYYSQAWMSFPKNKFVIDSTNDSYPVNWSVTAPRDTRSGEYYKVVAFSSQLFTAEESDNPPIIIGTPLFVQVATGASIGPQLFSEIKLENFSSFFNPLTGAQDFRFKVKNEGNITAQPTGYITIKNSGGQVMETLEFNEQNLSILPDNTQGFEVKFRSVKPLVGQFKAELWLGYKNSLKEVAPAIVYPVTFFYISPDLLLAALIIILTFILIKKVLTIRISYFLILIVLIPMALYFYRVIQTNNRLLGVKKELMVTATVREAIGLKVTRRNGRMVIRYTGNSPKQGWKLYSLRGSQGKFLASSNDTRLETKEIVLSKTDSRFPILLLAGGF